MTTQPKPELSLAEQEALSSSRVVWVIAFALVAGFVALFTAAIFRAPKYSSESREISRTPATTEVYSDLATQDTFKPTTKNLPKRAITPTARVALTSTPSPDLMTVVPPKYERPAEPLTPAELEFAKLLADFERKIPK